MKHDADRRTFLRAAAAAAGLPLVARSALAAEAAKSNTAAAAKLGWIVSSSVYTFRRFPLFEALDRIAALGFRHAEPAFFLPLDKKPRDVKVDETLSADLRKELRARLADKGIAMSSYYSNLGKDAVQNRKIFEFAKEMGVKVLVAEPPPEAFDGIEKLCDEFSIDMAIHNHPRAPNYTNWDPANVMKLCEKRSRRIGGCCDTGHWLRSGMLAIDGVRKMRGRIIEMHLKEVNSLAKPEDRDVPLGKGMGGYASVLEELHRYGFRGLMVIEYEHDSDKLMDDVKECIDFVETFAERKR